MTDATGKPATGDFDPDSYRMTFGEHLEELRYRLLMALGGLFFVVIACMVYGEHVMAVFCAPLFNSMHQAGMNPTIYYREISDPFVVYIEVALVSSLALASPWILYQAWQFIASGLYPNERRAVTKYIPLSVALLISGMLMLYYFVLPISIDFFLKFGGEIPIPVPKWTVPEGTPTTAPAMRLPVLAGDPEKPEENSIWINASEHCLKVFFDGRTQTLPLGTRSAVAPIITLPEYIDMVIRYLVIFGLAFQLPLVILALVSIGLVDIALLRSMRRYVYFGLAVLAAFIVPDVVTGMIALMVPLIALYEMGIFLAWWKLPKEKASD